MSVELTHEEKTKSFYLGDGLYMIDRGYDLEVFSSDGMYKMNAVYLDDNVLEVFFMRIKDRKINGKTIYLL